MPRNPHQQSQQDSRRATRRAYAERATVISVDDGNNHAITVRPESTGQDESAHILTTLLGDAHQPQVGERVLCVRRTDGRLIVIGSLYAEGDSIPTYEPGERVIGHPLSKAHVRFDTDGTIHIEADDGTTIDVDTNAGEVSINGGSTGVVTDVTGNDTDGSGDFDSLSITRSSKLFVP